MRGHGQHRIATLLNGAIDPWWPLVTAFYRGSDLLDSGPRKNNLTVVGTVGQNNTVTFLGKNTFDFSAGSLSNYLTAAIGVAPSGTTDFTIEAWAFSTKATTDNAAIYSTFLTGSRSSEILINTPGTTLECRLSADGSSTTNDLGAVALGSSVWGHACLQVKKGVSKCYSNGAPGTATGSLSTLASPSGAAYFGKNPDSAYAMKGALALIRLTIGVARYPMGGFVPPPMPYATNYPAQV
jgi:hypothetical protein